MKEPLLSFIIPFYNVENRLLERCINSVLNQAVDTDSYEIIIVDDGSDSFPEELILSFNRENITYKRQENRGPGGARNTGMESARGKYIHFLDADDYLLADTLNKCIDILTRNEIDILTFGFKTCREIEPISIRQKEYACSPITTGIEYMLNYNLSGCPWLYIFRKELLMNNRIHFEPGVYHEDEEFNTYLYYYAQRVMRTDLIVYAYYRREESIVKNKDKKHLNKRFADFKNVIKHLQQFKEEEKSKASTLQQRALNKKINTLACDYIIKMVRNHCSLGYIKNETNELRQLGLYPLPKENYTVKYKLFRLLTSRPVGIALLYVIEPFRKKI